MSQNSTTYWTEKTPRHTVPSFKYWCNKIDTLAGFVGYSKTISNLVTSYTHKGSRPSLRELCLALKKTMLAHGFGSHVCNGSVDIRRKLQYSQLFAHVILLFTVSEGLCHVKVIQHHFFIVCQCNECCWAGERLQNYSLSNWFLLALGWYTTTTFLILFRFYFRLCYNSWHGIVKISRIALCENY